MLKKKVFSFLIVLICFETSNKIDEDMNKYVQASFVELLLLAVHSYTLRKPQENLFQQVRTITDSSKSLKLSRN